MTLQIRPIEVTDAAAFADLFNQLLGETKFLLWEPGERPFDADFWQARIQDTIEEGANAFLLAEDEGRLLGFLRASTEVPRRRQHVALIVIAIRQSAVGQGVGTRLFEAMEAWARQKGLHRLELTVMTHNERAIALYKKMGFEFEGTLRHNLFIDGQYVDEYTMAKLIT